MEYAYAACLLARTGAEINEANLVEVLEAAAVAVDQSRAKATVAALEAVDIEEAADGGSRAGAAPLTLSVQSDATAPDDRRAETAGSPASGVVTEHDEPSASDSEGS